MLAAASLACVATVVTACVTVCAGCVNIAGSIDTSVCAKAVASASISGVVLLIVLLSEDPPRKDTRATCVYCALYCAYAGHTCLCAPPRRGHLDNHISWAFIYSRNFPRRNSNFPRNFPILTPYDARKKF